MNDYRELLWELRSEAENMRECNRDPWTADDYDKAANAIEQLIKERDAAVEDIHMNCETCRHSYRNNASGNVCDRVDNCTREFNNWEWRGVQEDNDEID